MKTIRVYGLLALAGLMVGVPAALADDVCSAEDYSRGAAGSKKADELERAGKLKESFETLQSFDGMCVAGRDGFIRYEAMRKRVGLALGRQAEKKGQLGAAVDWYDRSGNTAEADRVRMQRVRTSPRDRSLFAAAFTRVAPGDPNHTELLKLASRNADLEFAGEDKAFAARKESFDELQSARHWLGYLGEGAAKKVRERAEQRGDTLFKDDTYRHLDNARRYFDTAEAKQKQAAVKEKALRLAQAHEKKGEVTQAASFYELAGAGARGEALRVRAEAQHEKAEAKRQDTFKKEQADLEKELGLD